MEVMSVQLCVKVGLQNDVARWIRIFDTYWIDTFLRNKNLKLYYYAYYKVLYTK